MPKVWEGAGTAELERALVGAAELVAYPEVGDLSGLVARRIREAPVPVTRGRRVPTLRDLVRPVARPVLQPAWLKAAAVLALVVVVFSGTLVFSPSARRAVAGWLGLRGVKIVIVPTPSVTAQPSPALGEGLELGERLSLAQIQPRVPFQILVPAELGPPDEMYLRTDLAADQVTLLYRARPGLPQAATTGAGLLLTEFQARIDRPLLLKKVGAHATLIEPVTVQGQRGYWIEGAHDLYLIGPDGIVIGDSVRLAGNVLLWEHGPVTLRIEADITKAQALGIAASVR